MYDGQQHFSTIIQEHLNTSGVQQGHRENRISFTAPTPWPGDLVCAEGRYVEGDADTRTEPPCRRLHRPRFRHPRPPDLAAASSEAAAADFDVLIACVFSYDARAYGPAGS